MPKPDLPTSELHTRHGAGLLADAINAYWRARGGEACAERYPLEGVAWGVRSTMVRGVPVGFKGRAWRLRAQKASA